MTPKLLVAEDDPDVAEVVAFGARMTWPGCRVMIAKSGEEALRLFQEEPADLVVLDVSMPAPDGFEVCKAIRSRSQVPILMLTVRDSTLDKVRALDLGADDYLTKPFDHLELLARLRALVRRRNAETAPKSAGFEADGLSVDFSTHEVRLRGEVVRLTSTEYRLLEALARHPGTVLPHSFLMDQVWGPDYVGDPQALKVFVRRLRHKLGDDPDRPRYIQTEWGTGYRFVPPK
ncbi:MAG: response regulator transcription factor [Chloroflexota bacterium]|nr:response regulator transcription factor [Chloroflexota bacterium]